MAALQTYFIFQHGSNLLLAESFTTIPIPLLAIRIWLPTISSLTIMLPRWRPVMAAHLNSRDSVQLGVTLTTGLSQDFQLSIVDWRTQRLLVYFPSLQVRLIHTRNLDAAILNTPRHVLNFHLWGSSQGHCNTQCPNWGTHLLRRHLSVHRWHHGVCQRQHGM